MHISAQYERFDSKFLLLRRCLHVSRSPLRKRPSKEWWNLPLTSLWGEKQQQLHKHVDTFARKRQMCQTNIHVSHCPTTMVLTAEAEQSAVNVPLMFITWRKLDYMWNDDIVKTYLVFLRWIYTKVPQRRYWSVVSTCIYAIQNIISSRIQRKKINCWFKCGLRLLVGRILRIIWFFPRSHSHLKRSGMENVSCYGEAVSLWAASSRRDGLGLTVLAVAQCQTILPALLISQNERFMWLCQVTEPLRYVTVCVSASPQWKLVSVTFRARVDGCPTSFCDVMSAVTSSYHTVMVPTCFWLGKWSGNGS